MSSLFNASSKNTDFPTSFNTITYERGSNTIKINDFIDINNDNVLDDTLAYAIQWSLARQLGITSTDTKGTYYLALTTSFADFIEKRTNLNFNVTYHAITEGVTSVETSDFKHNGDMLISSNNASVDLYRMGVNMLSNLAMLGNEKYTCVLKLTSFDKRLRTGSLWIDDDNNRYIANVVKTTFTTDSKYVVVNVEFVKNYNMLNQNTQLFNEKRFYQIDNNLTTKGFQLYTDYFYLTLDSDNINKRSKVCYDGDISRYLLFSTLDNGEITRAFFSSRNDYEVADLVNLSEVNNASGNYRYCQIPLHTYTTGTTLNLEVSFENSVNARNRVITTDDTSKKIVGKSTLYCDESGFADYVCVNFCSDKESQLVYGENFPLTDNANATDNMFAKIDTLRYLKRDNEIFSLNYQICVLSYDKEIIISDTLLKHSASLSKRNVIKYMSVHESEYAYSIIDRKADNFIASCELDYVEYSTSNGVSGYYTLLFDRTINAKNIAITDEDNNVLLAINKQINDSKIDIYFFSSNKRLNLNED